MGTDDIHSQVLMMFTQGYCISSEVLMIDLMGTHGIPHEYCRYTSRVPQVYLTGTDHICYSYCGCSCDIPANFPAIFLTGTADSLYYRLTNWLMFLCG